MRPVLLLLALGACRVEGAFTCETDAACRTSTQAGRCEATGFCSFPDETCATGQRYAASAGDGLAHACSEAPLVDAATGPTFDTAVCPTKFAYTIPARPHARYARIDPVGLGGTAITLARTCMYERMGATHGANVTTKEVAAQLALAINPSAPGGRVYIGLVQDPTATAATAGLVNYDGTPAVLALFPTDEPNDGDLVENHAEDWGELLDFGFVNDTTSTEGWSLLCECDGEPMSSLALRYLGIAP